jgi:hypothetical protein
VDIDDVNNSGFDFAAFLESLQGLSDSTIKHKATARHAELRHIESSHKMRHTRESQTARLQDQISGLLWWIDTGIKPANMSEADFALCRALIKRKPS